MRVFTRPLKVVRIAFSLCIGGLLFTGCSTPQDVTSYTHPITGRRTDLMSPTLLDSESGREMLWLNAYRDYQNRYESRMYLEAIYGANKEGGYLDILPGRSLTIIADGNEMNLSGLGTLERKEDGNAVFESARYEVTQDDLEQIIDATKVTVQLRGRNGLVVREFGPENFASFRKFVDLASEAGN